MTSRQKLGRQTELALLHSAMEVGNKDWRRDKKTLKDRFEFLVNNEFGSDIKFLLRNGDQIFAHTFPLFANSPVFAAMFHGPFATKKRSNRHT